MHSSYDFRCFYSAVVSHRKGPTRSDFNASIFVCRYGAEQTMRPAILNSLFAPVSALAGVGPKIERSLNRLLGARNSNHSARVADLLFHLPYKLVDRRLQTGIANVVDGSIVTLKVHIDRHQPAPRGNRRIPYRVHVHDETAEMTVVFFNARTDWINRSLPVGEYRYLSGKVEWFNGRASMVHPDYMVAENALESLPLVEPIYPLSAGLSQKLVGKIASSAVDALPRLPEWTDRQLLSEQNWDGFADALIALHHPENLQDLDPQSPARRRLAYDELLAGQLALALMRESMRKSRGVARKATGQLSQQILRSSAL